MKKLSAYVFVIAIVVVLTGCATTKFDRSLKNGDIKQVEALINQGADVNQRGIADATPLYMATYYNVSLDIIRLLLDKGADPSLGMSGWKPIHMAVDNGNADIVKLLIERGADINALNAHHKTPLKMAEDAGRADIVRMLLLGTEKSDKKTSANVNKLKNYNGSKEMIAVMDFGAKDVSQSVALSVSELIRTELINTGKFTVIERSNMKEILKEQGLQQTGCTDASCAVKIGKLLSAKKILVGTIMKLGSKLIISGRIVNVETGIGENAASGKANSLDQLDGGVVEFVNNL